jgi:hypothetical protein
LRIKPTLESSNINTAYQSQVYNGVIYFVPIYNYYKYNYGLTIDLFQQKTTNTMGWEKFSFNKIFKREFNGVDPDISDWICK